MAIHWYLGAFLVLLLSSALSSWSLPTLPELELPHLHQNEKVYEATPVVNQNEAAPKQYHQLAISILKESGDQTGNSHSNVEKFNAAVKSSDWNEVMKMDLKGVKVDESIPALLTSKRTILLKKVLSEGLYDPETLHSYPTEFFYRDSLVMTIEGQLKIHFDSSMKQNKPDFVADLVRWDLVDVKEVLELSSKNQDFYNALVQNPTIQRRLIMNNDVETIRSLITKGSVRAEDILKEATKTKNVYVSSSLDDPEIVKRDLKKIFNNGQWDQLTQMNLKNVNVDDLLKPEDISKLEEEPEVLRYLLSQGSFSLEIVLKAKSELKPDSALTSLLESAVDKRLSEIIFKKDINKLSSLVQDEKIKLDRIMDLADEATLKSLVKTKAIQDNLFKSKDVDNIRLLASKDVLTVQEVINLAQQYGNRELKKEFENYQKKSIPIKVSPPQTFLHGKYKPVKMLSNNKWPPFDSENYPEVELKGKMFKPVKILGQGAYGQVVSYQNEQDPSEFVAVKIGLSKEPDYGSQTPQREELHLAKKTNLIKGKTAMLNGYSFTPMKLIRGETYENILKELQRPDEMVQQMIAVDKAIEDMSKLGVEHGDLHLNNIMYDPITNKATIIDFGQSASSSVTDDNGQKFQLNPYAERKQFLVDILEQLPHIKSENSKLGIRYDYEPVKSLIDEKLKSMEGGNPVKTVKELDELQSKKSAKLDELEKQTKSISEKTLKSKMDWKELMNLSKQKKHLIREIISLTHEKIVAELGANINPTELKKFQDKELYKAQKIMNLNSYWNPKLAEAHKEFQQAKLKLEGKEKPKLKSKSSSRPDSSSTSDSSQDPTKKKSLLRNFLNLFK